MATQLVVLVIDDSLEDQEFIRRALNRRAEIPYRVICECDAESALAVFHKLEPDVVLLDYMLPDLDGIEFIQELRANRSSDHAPESPNPREIPVGSKAEKGGADLPPIIMLTGQGNEQVAVEAMKEGATDYLVKGELTPQFLHRTIQRSLEKKSLECSLRQAEERFRASVETMLDSFGTYVAHRNEEGEIVGFRTEYINAAACDRDGFSMSQKSDELYVIEPPRWTEELFQEYCELVKTGLPLVKEIIVDDTSISDPSDPRKIKQAYDLRASRLGDGFVAVWREITGKKRAELERIRLLEKEKQARAAAEEANRLKDTFLAVVSHDLQTPLNSILGWVQMLKQSASERNLKRATEVIERSARSQLALIEDLLDLSRILRGSLKVTFQTINVLTLLDELVKVFYPLLKEKGIQLYLDLPDNSYFVDDAAIESQSIRKLAPLLILGDLNRLNQVLSNLISNAIKFTPRGGQIHLSLFSVQENIRIFVSDSGLGIEQESIELIFEPFRQSSQGKTSKGIGLGLAIARHVIELHQGRIWAESRGLGQGATFIVELPQEF